MQKRKLKLLYPTLNAKQI